MTIDPVRLNIEKVCDDSYSEAFPEILLFLIEYFFDGLDLRLRVDESLLDRSLESVETRTSPDISEIEKEGLHHIEEFCIFRFLESIR